MAHSDHGIVKDDKAQEQPADRKRAQAAHQSHPGKSGSHEATRDPRLNDAEKTPARESTWTRKHLDEKTLGSVMTPDDHGGAPTG